MAKRPRYSRFADRIDVDAFEDAIGFDVVSQTRTEDTGYCFDMFGLHAHGDTTGKFSINREKRVYNCWVCGGGSLLDLTMSLNDMDSEQATEWLLQFVEGELTPDESGSRLLDKLHERNHEEKKPLPIFNPHVLDRYDQEGDLLFEWAAGRGISLPVIDEYRIKYNAQAMKRPPLKPKYQDEDLYVGPAILLPHFFKGNLVGWQYRWLDDDRPEWVKKYTNTVDFPKDETLYNYDHAKRQQHPVFVNESVPTALFLESAGLPAVSTFGGTVTEDQKKLLRTFQQGVILAADNDKAGIKSRDELTEYLVQFIPVEHAPLVGEENSKDDLNDLAPDYEALYDHLEGCYTPLEEKWRTRLSSS